MRIAGVNIPDNKRVQISLTYIYGIGKSRAGKICEKAAVGPDTKVSALTEEEAARIRQIVQDEGRVEGDLSGPGLAEPALGRADAWADGGRHAAAHLCAADPRIGGHRAFAGLRRLREGVAGDAASEALQLQYAGDASP